MANPTLFAIVPDERPEAFRKALLRLGGALLPILTIAAPALAQAAGDIQVMVRGDVAWTSAVSTTRGTYRGKAVSSTGAESMVLTRGAEGWTISAIHWSSHDRPQR
jgi:hypothetical protein